MTPNVPPQEPQSATAPQIQMPSTSSNSSNKVILWFVIGLVVIVLVVGGVYFFLSRKQTAAPTKAPITQITPSPAAQQNLESDLDSINVDAAGTTGDFTAIDQDLQQL